MTGLLSINTETFLYALIGIVFIILLVWNVRLEIKLRRLLSGKNAKSLEDTIVHIKEGHDEFNMFRKEVERYLELVEKRLVRSVQGIETIRFNPFKGTGAGGNQSFSTAFLNESGSGVVISTLYARDRMSFFSKPVINFSSPHELTDEEKETIKKAQSSMKIDKKNNK
ncbi:DUF4446 family protein [Candidatus Kaiserbacteria bacterium]|nr:DUF4446 family protein [Candidatus Kaiserbacteria bacterium]